MLRQVLQIRELFGVAEHLSSLLLVSSDEADAILDGLVVFSVSVDLRELLVNHGRVLIGVSLSNGQLHFRIGIVVVSLTSSVNLDGGLKHELTSLLVELSLIHWLVLSEVADGRLWGDHWGGENGLWGFGLNWNLRNFVVLFVDEV